ncbi:MAG TPA: signal peptidase II [Vicinamibacterales bacterium]|nr:signal peptidase II [Vicinamibacterales bacterium]
MTDTPSHASPVTRPAADTGAWDVWVLAVPVVAADQAAKAVIRLALDHHESVTVIPGLLDLTHVRNTGAAFGLLNAAAFPGKAAVMLIVALVAMAAIAWYAARLPASERLARRGLGLVLGGAAGNLIDRAAQGYVLDFVDVYYGRFHFWAFNVADAAITVGATLVILDLLLAGRRHASGPR